MPQKNETHRHGKEKSDAFPISRERTSPSSYSKVFKPENVPFSPAAKIGICRRGRSSFGRTGPALPTPFPEIPPAQSSLSRLSSLPEEAGRRHVRGVAADRLSRIPIPSGETASAPGGFGADLDRRSSLSVHRARTIVPRRGGLRSMSGGVANLPGRYVTNAVPGRLLSGQPIDLTTDQADDASCRSRADAAFFSK